VLANRQRLRVAAELPAEPLWLEQVHGIDVARHSDVAASPPRADASVAFGPGQVCAVMTADCLPVVLADRDGRRVAVAHAGWRGLLDGVLQATLAALDVPGGEVWAWLGPAIGPRAFEVGAEVRDAYATRIAGSEACFERNERGRYQADLYGLATRVLEAAGVEAISGGGWCTHTMQDQYYSFRREGTTGRMATLAWLA
jgi:YfiH family protein